MSKWLNIQTIRILLFSIILLILANVFRLGKEIYQGRQVQQMQDPKLNQLAQKDLRLAEQEQALWRLKQEAQKQRNPYLEIQNALDLGRYLESVATKHKLKVLTLPQGEASNVKGYEVLEGTFQIEGSYLNIVRFVFQVEQEDKAGVIFQSQLKYQKYRVGGKQKEVLVATLHMRTVIQGARSSAS
ncbi:MAG: hypothetical protein AAFQ83_02520 [Bacteroidota bacterium]